ncbi:MAG: hypothetical protein ACU83P_07505 [Gammaproteobacteria bacterium]
MKKIIRSRLSHQYGAATLFTALILLICITLVTLLTSKTVITETQIAADNYRAAQAVAAANYSMDFGTNYFNLGGFDQDNNNAVDYPAVTSLPNLTSTDASQTTSAQLTFNNSVGTQCVAAGSVASLGKGMITATGFSDDRLGSRTVTQCVAPMGLLNGEGPDMPFIARGTVNLSGNARIINRYNNTTSWSGDTITIGSSSAMETYIKSPSAGVLSEALLTEVPGSGATPNNAILVSNRNLGNGLDIIDNDPSLKNLIGLNYFKNFFSVTSREQVRQLAASFGQLYPTAAVPNINSAIGKSGLIWFDGDQDWNAATVIGSMTKPSIVVINGNLHTSSSPRLYGVLYVAGKWNVQGTPAIVGSAIVEGTATPIDTGMGTAATPPIVWGNGTASVVFWPAFGSNADHPVPGLTTAIAGSWRDW